MERIERVNKIISQYFDEHLSHVKVSCGLDFYYDQEDEEVSWTFLTVERQDRTFNQFFEETLNCRKFHNFIYSLFHEYGHHVTLRDFSEAEFKAYRDAVDLIEGNDADKTLCDFTYYNLPVERAASEWAVAYINEHYDELVEWATYTLFPAIEAIFSNNEKLIEMVDKLNEEEELL